MLFVLVLVILSNAMGRTSELHIKTLIIRRYNFNDYTVRLLQGLYAILYMPGAIFGTIIYNRYSLRTGILVGTALTAIGAGFKA